MLKTVDVLIGLSVVMLVVSMAVTLITHFVTSAVNSRGRNLLKGLSGLLQQIDPTLAPKLADEIATRVLKHPLIAQAGKRLGSVIHREELTHLLLELASGEGAQRLTVQAQAGLTNLLEANGISDPGAVLANIRQVALQLEATQPALANDVRKNLAIVSEGASDFVAKMNAWFDQTIDRVSERFTSSARIITFVASLLVALVIQLDAIALINRLSMDDTVRTSLLQQSPNVASFASTANAPNAAGGSSENAQQIYYKKYFSTLAQDGLITLPQSRADWKNQWGWSRVPGILLSAFLLSLGAPFWYNALKNLIQLRSLIAGKDDDQRQVRQTTQSAGTGNPATAAAASLPGAPGEVPVQ